MNNNYSYKSQFVRVDAFKLVGVIRLGCVHAANVNLTVMGVGASHYIVHRPTDYRHCQVTWHGFRVITDV